MTRACAGPKYPLKLAIPLSLDIERRLTERADVENLPKTTLARKFILDGLRRADAA